MCCLMCGSSAFSRVFAIGESSEIGLYDVLSWGSLLGLGIGMIRAVFHAAGVMFLFIARL